MDNNETNEEIVKTPDAEVSNEELAVEAETAPVEPEAEVAPSEEEVKSE